MRKILTYLLPLFLMGCVTASGPSFVEPQEYSSEKATLFIYREVGYTHMAVCYVARLNGAKIGCLGNGSYIVTEVEPGKSTVSAALEDSLGTHSNLELEVSLEAGKKYFLKYTTELSYKKSVESGVGRRDFNIWLTGLVIPYKKGLFPVAEEIAMKELQGLKQSI